LDKPLKNYYTELDVIATPDGHPAVIIHANNCTNEINAWVNLFEENLALFGVKVDKGELFEKLFNHALNSDLSVGGMTGYNFLAGEPMAGTMTGAPMLVRNQDGVLNLANFMQTQIYSAIATIAFGTDILEKEGIKLKSVLAHGGYYKTPFVGQNATSAILKTPVTVMNTASEGGAWGMAVLALYCLQEKQPLSSFLDKVFAKVEKTVVMANEQEMQKRNAFFDNYKKFLPSQIVASKS
jgi:sugar (pentulose or hexulose) kinase